MLVGLLPPFHDLSDPPPVRAETRNALNSHGAATTSSPALVTWSTRRWPTLKASLTVTPTTGEIESVWLPTLVDEIEYNIESI